MEHHLKKGKVGLFGGTFDPFHFGHLSLVLGLKELHKLSHIYLVPARHSPLKTNAVVPFVHRLEMAKIAVEDLSDFQVLPIEEKKDPSYTIDTIRYLIEKHHLQNRLCLLLGEDVLESFPQWKDVNKIIELVDLLIGCRHLSKTLKTDSPALAAAIQKGLSLTKVMEISSTEIRYRLKNGLYCGHLLPAKVLDYIKQNSLY
jgi:nicotinate-nucleotide adenylyltransferase